MMGANSGGRSRACGRAQARAAALAVALLSATACDAPPPAATVAEPSAALRPVQVRGEIPKDARVADYALDVRLDETTHQIDGTARISWRNTSAHAVRELPFHLYMNAFRAEDTLWMRGSGVTHDEPEREHGGFGYIEVRAARWLALEAANTPPTDPGFAPPTAPPEPLTWAAGEDPTTMIVSLPVAVAPGERAVLELEFLTQLPRVFARTGYQGDFHMVGQWFPKLAVLEADGWKNHTFTANSEFFADFGDYAVELDVPATMEVGATGIRVGERVEGDRKHLSYRAEMVHDFAWVADPGLVEHLHEHEGIRIRQLMPREQLADADAHLEAQLFALASMQARFGPYPWSTITIVHPPKDAPEAAGMEYPTLFTSSAIPHPAVPKWVFEERVLGRFTTIHEFGHQYFQGMIATNEHAAPWLDEGINESANHLVYEDAYGDDAWLIRILGHEMGSRDVVRSMLRGRGLLDPIDAPADVYSEEVGSYGAMVYRKTAATMHTLREIGGHERFDAAMAAYAEQARFRHPRGDQLERALVEMADADGVLLLAPPGASTCEPPAAPVRFDVADFLAQALRDTSEADFALHRVLNRRRVGEAGFHERDGRLDYHELDPDAALPIAQLADEEVEGVVVIHRRGDLRLPVELEVEFADGERETLWWDGQARHRSFRWPGRRVVVAVVDPHDRLWLESHRHDNVRYADDQQRRNPRRLEHAIARIGEAAVLSLLGGLGP